MVRRVAYQVGWRWINTLYKQCKLLRMLMLADFPIVKRKDIWYLDRKGMMLTLMFLGLLHLLFGDAETSAVLHMEIHFPETVRNNSG